MERGPLLLAAALVAAAIGVAGGGGWVAALEGIVREAGGAPRESAPARSGPSDRERARRVSLRIDGAPTRGPAGAAVTIVEFGDFHCPYCARAQETLARVRERYGKDVA